MAEPKTLVTDPVEKAEATPDNYDMVGPGPDGAGQRLYTVPAANLQRALDAGWRMETAADREHEAKVKAEMTRQTDLIGGEGLNVGVDYFRNELLAGVPHVAAQYSDTPEEKEARDRLYAEHKVAAWTGGALGAAGNLLVTHGLGTELEAGLRGATKVVPGLAKAAEVASKVEEAAPFVSKLGRGALTGGAFAIPQAATQAANDDPEAAAETMLWGMGLGAGLTGVGELATKGINATASALGKTDWLESSHLNAKADEMTAARAGINPNKASKLGSDRLQQLAHMVENDEVMKGKKPGFETATALEEDAGMKLKEHWSTVDKLIENNPELKAVQPTPTSLANELTLQTMKEHPEFGITGLTPENLDMFDPKIAAPLFQEEVKAVEKIVQTIKQIGAKAEDDPMTMTQMQELKEALGSKTKFDMTSSPGVNNIRQEAYRFIKDKQMQLADSAYQGAGLTKQAADYELQKHRYRIAQDLLKYGEKEYTPNTYGIPLGSHFSNSFGAVIGGAAGGLPGAGIGYAASLLGKRLIGSYLENKWFEKGSDGLRWLAKQDIAGKLTGTMMARAAQQSLQSNVETSHKFIWRSAKNAPLQQANAFRHFLGSQANGLSKKQQYDQVASIITTAATSPQYTDQHVEAIKHVFGDNPQLAQLVADKNHLAINYLYQQLPKDPNPPRLFSKQIWTPSPKAMMDFANKLAIVQDPMYIMTKAQMGTLRPEDVEVAKYIYPKIISAIQNHLTLVGSSKDAPTVSHGMKMALEMITGHNITNPDMTNYQSAYVGAQPPNAPPGPAPTRGKGKGHTLANMNWDNFGSGSHSHKMDRLPSLQTKVGRLDSK